MTQTSSVGRRAFFRTLGAGAAATAAVSLTAPVALAQTAATPAPAMNGAGFYRYTMGSKTITVLADGNGFFPGQNLFAINATPEEFAEVQAQLLQPEDNIDFAMNALLVEEGDRKILIDAGFGHFLGSSFGRHALALANAGVSPGDIDTVIITHGHADHFAGLVDPNLKLRFPNAQIIWNAAEWAYWTSDQAVADVRASAQPEAFKDLFISTTQAVLPVAAPNVEQLDVSVEREVAPGILLLPAPGHTPGSIVVLIESGGEQLLYASDTTLLVKQNSIAPGWVSAFEYDGPSLVETRIKLLDRAASDGITWMGYHAAFPSLGKIRRAGDTFEFVEVPWRW